MSESVVADAVSESVVADAVVSALRVIIPTHIQYTVVFGHIHSITGHTYSGIMTNIRTHIVAVFRDTSSTVPARRQR